jgi:hypothetical protein
MQYVFGVDDSYTDWFFCYLITFSYCLIHYALMELEDLPRYADTGEEQCVHDLLWGHYIDIRMLRATSELRGGRSFEPGTSRIQDFEIY